MTDTVQDDATSFVVYVPPKSTTSGGTTTTDHTVESCLRLGVNHADEATTYTAICSAADAFLNLSSTYQPASGVALLTGGTINFTALSGVNTTAGTISNSALGQTYSVTKDGDNGPIISASLTDKTYGTWATNAFTQAKTLAVNNNFQGTFGLSSTYAFAGGLSFSNGLSAAFASSVGLSVNAPLTFTVTVGNNSVSTAWPFGDTFQYQDEASTTAKKITLTVDSSLVNPKLALFTAKTNGFVIVAKVAGIVIDAAILAYTASAGITADAGDPAAVKNWLLALEGVTIACTAVNGLLCALGTILGIIELAACKTPGPAATSVTIGDGTIELTTGMPTPATPLPTVNIDKTSGFAVHTGPANTKPAMVIAPAGPITLSMAGPTAPSLEISTTGMTLAGNTAKGTVKMDDSSLTLAFGTTATVKLDASGITLTSGTNSLVVANSGVTINGTKVSINAPQTSVTPAPQVVPATPVVTTRPPLRPLSRPRRSPP